MFLSSDRVFSVCFSSDGKQIASGSWDTTVKIWNASSGELQSTLRVEDHMDAGEAEARAFAAKLGVLYEDFESLKVLGSLRALNEVPVITSPSTLSDALRAS